jgi:hypothetical protein
MFEINKMAKIFNGAVLTFAAASAKSANEGFLRNQDVYRPATIYSQFYRIGIYSHRSAPYADDEAETWKDRLVCDRCRNNPQAKTMVIVLV